MNVTEIQHFPDAVVPELLNLLIVDDQASIRTIVRRLLNQIGIYSVKEAVDGIDALRLMGAHNFDAVICDRNIAIMDGIEFFQRMKTFPLHNQKPFIMLSSDVSERAITEARRAGIKLFLKKPCSSNTLKNTLEKALGSFTDPYEISLSLSA